MVNAGKDDIQISPLAHYKMADSLVTKKRLVANLCARGFGKTVVMGEMLVLYLAIFNILPILGKCNVIMYVADTMDNGAKSFRHNVESRYAHSDFLKKYIPQVKFTDSELIFKNIQRKETYIRLFGATSGVRGFKRNGDRPVLAILDDLMSDEVANSNVQLNKIRDLIYKAVDNALNPQRNKIIFSGTPFNKADPLYRAIESGAWEANVYPICSHFPCTKEEFDPAWEERFDYDKLKEKYEEAVQNGEIKAFNQELLLRISSEADRVILDEDIQWFNVKDIMQHKQRYNFYITSDFATSNKSKSDFTAIGVWAVDSNQNRYLIDGIVGRFLMNKTFDYIFQFVEKYNPMSVGLEITGQQGGFIPLFEKEMITRNVFFTIARRVGSTVKGIGTKQNKMDRFRLTEPFFKRKKIFLPLELKDSIMVTELVDELKSVTIDGIKSVHDDAIDMTSQLDQMVIVYPSEYQANLGKGFSQDKVESFGINENPNTLDNNYIDYLA